MFTDFDWHETSLVDRPANNMEGWLVVKAAANVLEDAGIDPDQFEKDLQSFEKSEAVEKQLDELVGVLNQLRVVPEFQSFPDEVQKSTETLITFFGNAAEGGPEGIARSQSRVITQLMGLLTRLVPGMGDDKQTKSADLVERINDASPDLIKAVADVAKSDASVGEQRDLITAAVAQFAVKLSEEYGGDSDESEGE